MRFQRRSFISASIYRATTSRRLAPLHLSNFLSHFGIVARIRVSPEGYRAAELARLVAWLHARGERLFVPNLHSPSLASRNTPYMQSACALQTLLGTLHGLLRFFIVELGGVPTDPLVVHTAFGQPDNYRNIKVSMP